MEVPKTSPASSWPTADSVSTSSAGHTSVDDRPATIRVKKKRKLSRPARLRILATRLGYGLLAITLLAGLVLVAALIIGPHHLF
ncbi:hypothetical protein C5C66_01725 [Rathayibacter toxicus]|uniref:Uncharacterized protein n=1 Tax=Rathayibacter toxicus TaxID=145458 RepID=A0A0C5BFW1_9MICO|nr:hypothetical protein TI83_01920 [Rathayibacter toxicus]ALS57126.1 hypothetical protein APU90_04565 [Rathayibacter toxicus]KKM46062.1 hypothetical protein VT73_02930 [Rathayibacter toxicus]PPG22996.1 hypothetical protein C5D15_01700 [Rathayibacter toxicus]PPG47578.1 hypothetical protein C5D16_01695 [Rathayibacter toxicus]